MNRGLCNYGHCRQPLASKLRCAEHRYAGSPPAERRICDASSCDRPAKSKGLCNTHNERRRKGILVATMTIDSPIIKKGTLSGPDSGRWAGDQVTYAGAHHRMRFTMGSARRQKCSCGRGAHGWAYDYTDPNEKLDDSTGLLYSTDMSRYKPMCGSCHKKHDNAEMARRRARRG